jgi:hypothetical protein
MRFVRSVIAVAVVLAAASDPAAAAETPRAVVDAADRVVAVVDGSGSGAAVAIGGDGRMVTSAALVRNLDEVRFVDAGGRLGTAVVEGTDARTGVAVLRSDAPPRAFAAAPRGSRGYVVRSPLAKGPAISRAVLRAGHDGQGARLAGDAPESGTPVVDRRGRLIGLAIDVDGRTAVVPAATLRGLRVADDGGPSLWVVSLAVLGLIVLLLVGLLAIQRRRLTARRRPAPSEPPREAFEPLADGDVVLRPREPVEEDQPTVRLGRSGDVEAP